MIAKLFARPQSRRDRRRTARLGLEPLEGRDVPTGMVTVEALGTANENGTGSPLFRFTRTGSLADEATGLAYLGGTATYDTDYTANAYLYFGVGQSTWDVAISVVNDTVYEGPTPESIAVTGIWLWGGGGSYGTGSPGTAQLDIVDNDPAPVVAVGAAWDAVEGGAWGVFRFTRDGDTAGALTFSYTVQSSGTGVATPGTDYTSLSGTATFAAGEDVVDVEVEADLDATTETPETVTVTVDDGTDYDTAEGFDEATVTIADPGPTVVSVYRLYDAAEGHTGSFLFSRTGDLSDALTVTYTVETVGPGLATAGDDFAALSGTVTIAAGSPYAVVDVEGLTDNAVEGAEPVTVHISTSTNYDTDVDAATVYVTDDPPTVWIDSSPLSVDEGDSGSIVLKRVGGNLDEELSVPVNISVGDDEDLIWVDDFAVTGVSGDWSGWNVVTFPAGEDTVTITLDAVLDDETEDAEEVLIELDTGSNSFSVGAVSSAAIAIANIVPNITVPIQAGEPLNQVQAAPWPRTFSGTAGTGGRGLTRRRDLASGMSVSQRSSTTR